MKKISTCSNNLDDRRDISSAETGIYNDYLPSIDAQQQQQTTRTLYKVHLLYFFCVDSKKNVEDLKRQHIFPPLFFHSEFRFRLHTHILQHDVY